MEAASRDGVKLVRRRGVAPGSEPALHHYHNTYRAALGMELLPLLED